MNRRELFVGAAQAAAAAAVGAAEIAPNAGTIAAIGGAAIAAAAASAALVVTPAAAQSGQMPIMNLWTSFIADNAGDAVLVSSSGDGVSWTNNLDINQTSKFGPSLAVFNNKLYVAFIANNPGNEVLVCSTADGPNWSNNTDINQTSKFAPSLAVFNSKLYVAFIADNPGNAVLVCSSADGVNWTNNTDINQTSKFAPSLAVFNNKLYVAFLADNPGNAVLVCSSADGVNWTNNININQTSNFAPSLAATQFPLFEQGYYWQNWPVVFGYVTPNRRYPRSLADIVAAVQEAAQKGLPIKAVGGGWSFSDASLPIQTQGAVDAVSIAKRGANGAQNFKNILQGLNNNTTLPADFLPENIESTLAVSQTYDQKTLQQTTDSGPNLPPASNTLLVDTRGLASSLQSQLYSIMSDAARNATANFFHVEAGIVMADLDQLLDHQNPRLALQASGGSVGATLAGVLASATHGAEFQWPLLVDGVRAIHLVGPDGSEWWIEGEVSIADLKRLQTVYPNIQASRFIAGNGQFVGLGAQNVLNAVIVSMGTMGVVYSVVLEVVPQFGLQQICAAIPPKGDMNSWETLLQLAGTSVADLRQGHSPSNVQVLNFLLDGSANGTGIPFNAKAKTNVFCDLAINPLNLDCWVTNRQVTPSIPIDGNSPAPNWLPALSQTLGSHAVDTVQNNKLVGRIFDFLNWATDVPSVNLSDDINDIQQSIELATFITSFPDILVAGAATLSAQAVANTANEPNHPDRGQEFLGDALSGFLHAVQGTANGTRGNTTDVSYKIWGFGWPANGFPGRGLEIALPQETAFTFIQNVLFDDVLTNTMRNANKPLIGYISVRVCPPTNTLMGMQQFSPFSIMIEVVAYRSPEANVVMDHIQTKALAAQNVMLHWGLENDQMTSANLSVMPVSRPLAGTTETRLSAFKKVRQLLTNGKSSSFVNNFVSRLNL